MLFGLLAALVAEVTLCQFSFWTSAGKEGEDLTKRAEVAGHYFTAEDMESVQGSGFEDFFAAAVSEEDAGEGEVYIDREG